ncbi:hypothetical protein TSAR_006070 [Trichomalopsis sarcophagae]|uniref:Fatty acyl-CoA reductase n=1 Tax=Trichomalopsis sarcophagae TaxID=543379 RepID=A0A232F2B4_9HYME|nr:hypothetical protein TSAR_006070 [Trichomalopsis sarcophagae]
MIELCKDMEHLKSLVHVSTAYANCFVRNVEERFYDYSLKYHHLLNLVNTLPEDIINAITPQLIDSWPNTYTFTKALAEDLVRTENKSLPMGIFRPGIVTSAANEPTPGWTDNHNGPMGVMAGVASGVMRTFQCDPEVIPNIVPVDFTVNAMIACAWDIASQTEKRNEDMLIYNFTSTEEAPISWGVLCKNAVSYIDQYPSEVTCWYAVLLINKFKFIYTLYALFLHWIPAYLVDLVSRCVGQNPRLQKVYEKMDKLSNVLNTFCINEWSFKNTNVQNLWTRLDSQDKQLFPFTMQNFDWHSYLDNYMKGIRMYLLKDDMKTLESSKIKYNRLYYIHYSTLISISFLACWLMYCLYSVII